MATLSGITRANRVQCSAPPQSHTRIRLPARCIALDLPAGLRDERQAGVLRKRYERRAARPQRHPRSMPSRVHSTRGTPHHSLLPRHAFRKSCSRANQPHDGDLLGEHLVHESEPPSPSANLFLPQLRDNTAPLRERGQRARRLNGGRAKGACCARRVLSWTWPMASRRSERRRAQTTSPANAPYCARRTSPCARPAAPPPPSGFRTADNLDLLQRAILGKTVEDLPSDLLGTGHNPITPRAHRTLRLGFIAREDRGRPRRPAAPGSGVPAVVYQPHELEIGQARASTAHWRRRASSEQRSMTGTTWPATAACSAFASSKSRSGGLPQPAPWSAPEPAPSLPLSRALFRTGRSHQLPFPGSHAPTAWQSRSRPLCELQIASRSGRCSAGASRWIFRLACAMSGRVAPPESGTSACAARPQRQQPLVRLPQPHDADARLVHQQLLLSAWR